MTTSKNGTVFGNELTAIDGIPEGLQEDVAAQIDGYLEREHRSLRPNCHTPKRWEPPTDTPLSLDGKEK